MNTKAIVAGFTVALLALPFVTSAATINDLQTELQGLLSQIASLQVQGSASATVAGNTSSSLSGSVTGSCPSLSRSLGIGSTGADVTALQQFLVAQGDLHVAATGYFGALTQAAVGKWQVQSGIVAYNGAGFGMFGPLSRSYFSKNCSGTQGGTTTANGTVSFTASPISGQFPLTVQFVATAPQGTTLGNTVNFGDGTSGTLGFVPVCSSCNAEATVTHVYASAGTYTATLTSGMCSCPANGICNCPNMMIIATTSVTVGSTTAPSANIQQLNAPGSVTLQTNGIAEIRNESFYFTLESLTASTATIQITPVGCWNSFPSDPTPQIRCMLAMLPIPPQTLSIGQAYTSNNYGVTLTQLNGSNATFSVTASSTTQY